MKRTVSFLILAAFTARAENYVWTGAFGGAWNVPANWAPAAVPNASDAFARIDTDAGKAAQVSLVDTSVALGGLTVDNGLVLTLHQAAGLTNNGTVRLSSGGSYTYLRFNGSQTLAGTGALVLNDRIYNAVQLAGTQPVLTQSAGHTLRGAGYLLGNTGDLINEGAVLAQGSNAPLIDPLNAFVNRGTLRAEGPGGLALEAGAYTNAGQALTALDGSKVVLRYGVRLVGGTLRTEGSGRIVPLDGAALDGGITVEAGCVVTQATACNVTVSGGLTNNGVWNLSAVGNYTYLEFDGSQTLGGSGKLALSDRIYNVVRPKANGQTLTHGPGHTIRGAGYLLDGLGSLDNYGRILATGAARLVINPYAALRNLAGGTLGGRQTPPVRRKLFPKGDETQYRLSLPDLYGR